MPCIYRIITDFSFLQESTKIEPIRNNAEISKQKEPTSIVQPVAKKVEKETRIAPTESIESVRENIVIPTLEEFMKFAKTLEIYDESMDFAIKSKYESWVDAGWKNGLGMSINKWENNLKNTLPYLKRTKPSPLSINKIPTIKRPKPTYNE